MASAGARTDTSPDRAGDGPAPSRRGRRARGAILVALGFLAGSFTSGAGAVWASHQFSDVPASNQFHADIDWMVDNGITNGYGDGTFRPTAPVSRQAFAAFLRRYNEGIELVNGDVVDPGSGTTFFASATCPVGKHAISGNALTFDSTIALAAASPTTGRKWQAMWISRSGSSINPGPIAVSALCIPD